MADLNNNLTEGILDPFAQGHTFWARLIWALKLGRPEGKIFWESKLRCFV